MTVLICRYYIFLDRLNKFRDDSAGFEYRAGSLLLSYIRALVSQLLAHYHKNLDAYTGHIDPRHRLKTQLLKNLVSFSWWLL